MHRRCRTSDSATNISFVMCHKLSTALDGIKIASKLEHLVESVWKTYSCLTLYVTLPPVQSVIFLRFLRIGIGVLFPFYLLHCTGDTRYNQLILRIKIIENTISLIALLRDILSASMVPSAYADTQLPSILVGDGVLLPIKIDITICGEQIL